MRPKDDAARETLADGFAKVWHSAKEARSTLIGSVGDEEAFKKVNRAYVQVIVKAIVDNYEGARVRAGFVQGKRPNGGGR